MMKFMKVDVVGNDNIARTTIINVDVIMQICSRDFGSTIYFTDCFAVDVSNAFDDLFEMLNK